MRIYVLKQFDRNLKRTNLSDKKLYDTANEIYAGIYEADLGGGLYKKRIALNAGKSGGVRAVVAFKFGNDMFFC